MAALLQQISRHSQVVAISHRAEFQRAADAIVALKKEKDHTVVASAVAGARSTG